jgi:hypothetical protein
MSAYFGLFLLPFLVSTSNDLSSLHHRLCGGVMLAKALVANSKTFPLIQRLFFDAFDINPIA